MHSPLVSIEHLSHRFGTQTVLDNISLSIPKGSIYGFLGPNGAGKTTTLRLMLGLLPKQSGSIRLFGGDFHKNRIEILRRIGSLIEQPSLYLHLSAKENLEIFRLSYQCRHERIGEVLEIVGLAEEARKKVRNYSLGMKQRLSIAIALLNDPELLILDEPVNGLDPNGIIEIRNLIKELNTSSGKTILISSHLLPEIEKVATRIGIIDNGRVMFQEKWPQPQKDLESLFIASTNS